MAKGKRKGTKGSQGKRAPANRPATTRDAAGAPAASDPAGTAKPRPAPAATRPAASGGGGRAPRAKPTQAERFEAARRRRRRKALQIRAGVAGGVALVVAVVAVLVVRDRSQASRERERLTAGSCTYDTRADRLTADNHTPPRSYGVDPPAGGDHDPSPAPAGFFGEGRPAPTDAQLVHSMEHGLVVLWHRPDLPEAEVTAIRGVFDDHSDDAIVVPRASLTGKVAATSWGRRLLCGEVEPERLSEFIDLYRDKSPEPGVR